jgi:hypothetical protein
MLRLSRISLELFDLNSIKNMADSRHPGSISGVDDITGNGAVSQWKGEGMLSFSQKRFLGSGRRFFASALL